MAARIWKTWATVAALALAAAVCLPAGAQQEGPGRAARLSQADAGVQWSGADGNWQTADPNWPFTAGDSIRVAAGSRAELHAGAHALRLQGPAELGIDALDDNDLRLTLRQGSLNLRARDMAPDERIEVNTQNLAMLVDRPGEFRVDVEPGSTRVLARSGTATLYGDGGESAALAPAQQARYVGRTLSAIAVQGAGPRDPLDQWAADRSLAEDRSPSAQYLSREVLGYQELDANGEWTSTVEYGTVWYPRTTIANWEPYRHGQWRWVDPWGWTWFDDARWGFAPFHYGRWVQIGPRWAWVPGPRGGPRPFYAPALVGFAGAPAPRPPNFNRHRTPGTDWFPLAPGQPWRPGFGAGPRDPGRGDLGLPPPAPLRNTQRERPPGPGMAMPAPGFQQPGRGADQERRERWQREQEWQQQQRRQQQRQDQDRSEMHQRHEQIRQDQQRRQDQMQQQQRTLQDQQTRQMQQLRQQQEQQQRQLQEPQRQQERFMRDAQRDQMERREQREQRQDRPQPPRAAPPQDQRQPPGERGGRFGNRD